MPTALPSRGNPSRTGISFPFLAFHANKCDEPQGCLGYGAWEHAGRPDLSREARFVGVGVLRVGS